MEKVTTLSKATDLYVNPSKCKAFYGGMDNAVKINIFGITTFLEETLPFRYLGVPLTSRKLATSHYMSLVDKIVMRIRH